MISEVMEYFVPFVLWVYLVFKHEDVFDYFWMIRCPFKPRGCLAFVRLWPGDLLVKLGLLSLSLQWNSVPAWIKAELGTLVFRSKRCRAEVVDILLGFSARLNEEQFWQRAFEMFSGVLSEGNVGKIAKLLRVLTEVRYAYSSHDRREGYISELANRFLSAHEAGSLCIGHNGRGYLQAVVRYKGVIG